MQKAASGDFYEGRKTFGICSLRGVHSQFFLLNFSCKISEQQSQNNMHYLLASGMLMAQSFNVEPPLAQTE